jgi:hypothetical protein
VEVGVVPLVVYRIDAPLVVVLMVTIWVEVYLAGAGLNIGATAAIV